MRINGRISARRWPISCLHWLAGAGIIMALAACSERAAERVAVSHPWLNPPTVADAKSIQLPAWLVYRVDDEVYQESIKVLEVEPYIQISPAMASYYIGEEVRVPAEMRPFLVRAVRSGEGLIDVIQLQDGLWMKTHLQAGADIAYQPLVVLIDPTPREIYVTVE